MTKIEVDPFTVTTEIQDQARFTSLDFFGQLDAAVNNASKPALANFPPWIIGGIWLCIHAAVVIGLTCYFSTTQRWTPDFHEALLKNVIAYDGIMMHNGFAMLYRILGYSPEPKIKYSMGSIKEPHNSVVARIPGLGGHRRTLIDMFGHIAWDLARVWLIISPAPSPLCAWVVFATMAWMYLFDHCEYVGSYGMYHGPWSVFIVAKYYTATQQAAATSMLQVLLILLYVGCGLGKMGPWFVAVFNQEWTLPPWAAAINLKPLLYNKDFPRDNRPSCFGVATAYIAASAEWLAPIGFFLTASVVGGATGSMSTYVYLGLFTVITMHFYINVHMPAFDVWMLNTTPAYLAYNVFYLCPTLKEPGFDYLGWATLHPAFKLFCCFMALYCAYGQIRPEKMTYMLCYRFWAGNWPQCWVLVSEAGMAKVDKAFPKQTALGRPGKALAELQGPNWAFNTFGIFQTAQLPHRAMPMAMHKALMMGAKARGEEPAQTLTEFQDQLKGFFAFGPFFFSWYTGIIINDCLRCKYLMGEMHKECNFEAGEMIMVQQHSFPVFSQIFGGKSHWLIMDGSKLADDKGGILDEGWLTVDEALAVTKPSVWADYESKKGPLLQTLL